MFSGTARQERRVGRCDGQAPPGVPSLPCPFAPAGGIPQIEVTPGWLGESRLSNVLLRGRLREHLRRHLHFPPQTLIWTRLPIRGPRGPGTRSPLSSPSASLGPLSS